MRYEPGMKCAVALVASMLLTQAPALADDDDIEAQPITHGVHGEIAASGGVMFLAAYLTGAMSGTLMANASSVAGWEVVTRDITAAAWIPVAGPLILGAVDDNPGRATMFIIDGVAQIAGLALVIVGLAWPKTTPIHAARVMPMPIVSKETTGFAVTAMF